MYRRQTAISRPAENTCTWLLGHDLFESWLGRTNVDKYQDLLWIKGKPGSGKSTIVKAISSHVTQHAKQSGLTIATSYFIAKGTELERTKIGLLRSLVSQILHVQKQHVPALIQIYEEKRRQLIPGDEGGFEWNVRELEDF
jgi:Cdc6-like AAA superfamily ATPase